MPDSEHDPAPDAESAEPPESPESAPDPSVDDDAAVAESGTTETADIADSAERSWAEEMVAGDGTADNDEDSDGGIPNRKLLTWGLVLGFLYLLISVLDVVWASYRVTDASAPAAVVLGAAQYNGEPSEALKRRLDRAAELYNDDRVSLIVVTGGGQEADVTTEAKTGYDYLRETASIPDEDLRLEVQGSSTYESLAAAERFLEPEGVSEVILVTDRYHARRSQLIAAEVGLDASVYPTEGELSISRVAGESAAVAAGRVVGFRRLNNYLVG